MISPAIDVRSTIGSPWPVAGRSICRVAWSAFLLGVGVLNGLGCRGLTARDRGPDPVEANAAAATPAGGEGAVHAPGGIQGQPDEAPETAAPDRPEAPGVPQSDPPPDVPERNASGPFPWSRQDLTKPDIRNPGPDTANFPNSAFTLPRGRFTVEVSPVFLSGPSVGTAKSYNAEFLLRYGLTDRVELRLFGNGPAFEKGRFAANGMSPLAWDLKINLWPEDKLHWIPAVGLETFILTPTGSPGLNQGTQASINLLFDHSLPLGILFEWNIGVVGDPSSNNRGNVLEPVVAWAFQRELVEDFDVFFQGFFNGATLPRFGDGVVLGAGAVWTINTRLAVFGSYNAGVTPEAPTTIFQLGGAVAF
jgi:hypothetical protein